MEGQVGGGGKKAVASSVTFPGLVSVVVLVPVGLERLREGILALA